jgi:hypothetical protein
MKLLHFALYSLVDKAASFNVVCTIIALFDRVLVLFSPCKYKVIYRSLLLAYSFCVVLSFEYAESSTIWNSVVL